MQEMEAIGQLLSQYDCGEIFFADDAQQRRNCGSCAGV